jgi:hypothetical protein
LPIEQCIALRAALESFYSSLERNRLGDDPMGAKMAEEQIKNIKFIMHLIFNGEPHKEIYKDEHLAYEEYIKNYIDLFAFSSIYNVDDFVMKMDEKKLLTDYLKNNVPLDNNKPTWSEK